MVLLVVVKINCALWSLRQKENACYKSKQFWTEYRSLLVDSWSRVIFVLCLSSYFTSSFSAFPSHCLSFSFSNLLSVQSLYSANSLPCWYVTVLPGQCLCSLIYLLDCTEPDNPFHMSSSKVMKGHFRREMSWRDILAGTSWTLNFTFSALTSACNW